MKAEGREPASEGTQAHSAPSGGHQRGAGQARLEQSGLSPNASVKVRLGPHWGCIGSLGLRSSGEC